MLKCKKILTVSVLSLFYFALNSQSYTNQRSLQRNPSPTMPTVSVSVAMPAMPTISTPSIASSWYTPGQTNITIIEDEKKLSLTSPNSESENMDVIKSVINDAKTNLVTTADLINMKSLGLLGNMRTLLSSNENNLPNLLSVLQNTKDSNTSSIPTYTGYQALKASFQPESASLLRFIVNGTDISSNCHNIFFSGIENNGTFLITGDYKSNQDNQPLQETFYFLFKTEGTSSVQTVYSVTPAVTQNIKNENTALYKLSQSKNLKATKTGALVVIHDNSKPNNVDLILDIGTNAQILPQGSNY